MSGTQTSGDARTSVIGYMPAGFVRELEAGKAFSQERVEVPLEPGKGGSVLRIQSSDIEEVRLGPSHGDHTSVQLVLSHNADYELVTRGKALDDALAKFADPGTHFGVWGPPGRIVIYARPVWSRPSVTGAQAKES